MSEPKITVRLFGGPRDGQVVEVPANYWPVIDFIDIPIKPANFVERGERVPALEPIPIARYRMRMNGSRPETSADRCGLADYVG